ncbi:MAG: carboxypeptidase-like regulatory domain-containing protein [Ignavibacteria bacterium]|nr:carboxypeptidase-like regulatory domain-containing protein [Ignavibacteria bacterium]
MKLIIKIFILFLLLNIFSTYAYNQTHKIYGKIYDLKTNQAISYVNIAILDSNFGTTSDKNGDYILNIKKGFYNLSVSHIGYFSDTASVYVEDKDIERNIYLLPSEIFTEEIRVEAEDPAYEIITKAIQYKKKFKENLKEYNYNAFSKFIIRTSQSALLGNKDESDTTGGLKILGVLESETIGYFKKPDTEKFIVKSKRETANISRGIALPLIVNFYDERIVIGNEKIPGPLSDDAFDKYDYKLIGTTSIDSTIVYKINVENNSRIFPGFNGKIYIIDSIFALIKTDLSTNKAANPEYINKLNFVQKFKIYKDKNDYKFWMPTDLEIAASGSLLGILKFEGEAFTIISNYNLDEKAPPEVFNDFIVNVLPGSEKDSSFWRQYSPFRESSEEKKAILKLEKRKRERESEVSFGLSTRIGKNFSINNLDLYHFNKIEGHYTELNLSYISDKSKYNIFGLFGYGFSDKKSKYELKLNGRFLRMNNLSISAAFYDRLNLLYYPWSGAYNFNNTVYCLFFKQSISNMYYATGYNLKAEYSPITEITFSINYLQEKQKTAYTNTDYSFFRKEVTYTYNPPIVDGFNRKIGFGFDIDVNKYKFIDWGNGDISKFSETSFPKIKFVYGYSGKKYLQSNFEIRDYLIELRGQNKINRFINFTYRGIYHELTGDVPLQELLYLPSAIDAYIGPLRFKSMNYLEFVGNKIFYFNIENNFGKFFPWDITLLNNLNLIGFISLGRSFLSEKNFNASPYNAIKQTDGLYAEIGFGIDKIFDLVRVDFCWRLSNYSKGNNFTAIFFFPVILQ